MTATSSNSTARRTNEIVLMMISLMATSAFGQSVTYDFELSSSGSTFSASVSVGAATAGSLIGNYDAVANPEGTRTKPGFFGPFGDTENVEVPAEFAFDIAGSPLTHPTGSFRLEVNYEENTVSLSEYFIDYLGGEAASLPATLTVGFDTFRTRSPDSLFIGATLPLPLGSLSLNSLQVVQQDIVAIGQLTSIGDLTYSFLVTPIVELSGSVDLLGNAFEIPPTPLPFSINGTFTLGEAGATITSISPLLFDINKAPNLELPEIPFDLPTLLPPGGTAHLQLHLTLTEFSTFLGGEVILLANGVALLPGDCDGNGDVSLFDYTAWIECFTGPNVPTTPGCGCGDLNDSQRSDLVDFAAFQRGFSPD